MVECGIRDMSDMSDISDISDMSGMIDMSGEFTNTVSYKQLVISVTV